MFITKDRITKSNKEKQDIAMECHNQYLPIKHLKLSINTLENLKATMRKRVVGCQTLTSGSEHWIIIDPNTGIVAVRTVLK